MLGGRGRGVCVCARVCPRVCVYMYVCWGEGCKQGATVVIAVGLQWLAALNEEKARAQKMW